VVLQLSTDSPKVVTFVPPDGAMTRKDKKIYIGAMTLSLLTYTNNIENTILDSYSQHYTTTIMSVAL
jgi:hypothetical protein